MKGNKRLYIEKRKTRNGTEYEVTVRSKFRNQSRHYKDLLDRLREYLKTYTKSYVTKEKLAIQFKAKDHEIEQCLHKLNLEGLVSQAIKKSPWSDHGWVPDYYSVNNDMSEKMKSVKEQEELEKAYYDVKTALEVLKYKDEFNLTEEQETKYKKLVLTDYDCIRNLIMTQKLTNLNLTETEKENIVERIIYHKELIPAEKLLTLIKLKENLRVKLESFIILRKLLM